MSQNIFFKLHRRKKVHVRLLNQVEISAVLSLQCFTEMAAKLYVATTLLHAGYYCGVVDLRFTCL